MTIALSTLVENYLVRSRLSAPRRSCSGPIGDSSRENRCPPKGKFGLSGTSMGGSRDDMRSIEEHPEIRPDRSHHYSVGAHHANETDFLHSRVRSHSGGGNS